MTNCVKGAPKVDRPTWGGQDPPATCARRLGSGFASGLRCVDCTAEVSPTSPVDGERKARSAGRVYCFYFMSPRNRHEAGRRSLGEEMQP